MYTNYAHTHTHIDTYMRNLCANVHLHVDTLITSPRHAHSQLQRCYLGRCDHVFQIQIFSQRAREQESKRARRAGSRRRPACMPTPDYLRLLTMV